MEAPFNAPADGRTPTMDGFALDFYGELLRRVGGGS
jgi:hypothetical protein